MIIGADFLRFLMLDQPLGGKSLPHSLLFVSGKISAVTASRKEQPYVSVLFQFFDLNRASASFVALQAVVIANQDSPFRRYLFHN
jgi:hypothetical protein